ncbi:MAG: hypothetical protein EXQ94_00365 [Alphaproteobacteria bacterium]|nr:hypothetical protein [Alphaproteobacteria bacterium]
MVVRNQELLTTRRAALIGGVVSIGVFGMPRTRSAQAGLPTSAAFSIIRDGNRIGSGSVTFEHLGVDLKVRMSMDAKVEFGFIELFRYRHEAEETWREGRLIGVEAYTDDNGEERWVTGRAKGDVLQIEGPKGRIEAPGTILPNSYWHPDTVLQSQLLDVSKGRLRSITVARLELESLLVGGYSIAATRYEISGDLKVRLWYDAEGAWLRSTLHKKGSDIDIVLDAPPALAAAELAPALAGRMATKAQTRVVAAASESN